MTTAAPQSPVQRLAAWFSAKVRKPASQSQRLNSLSRPAGEGRGEGASQTATSHSLPLWERAGVRASQTSAPLTTTQRLQTRARSLVASASLMLGLGLGVIAPQAQAASAACVPSAGFTNCIRVTASGADQAFTVPANVNFINIKAWGAGGGGTLTHL